MSTQSIALVMSACVLASAPFSIAAGSGSADETYGKLADGRAVKLFTLTNKSGLKARVMEFGAILVSMEVPDKNGKLADVTHGYDTLAGWVADTSYMGSSVGRFGNRIKDGKFSLNGKSYTLATNDKPGEIPCHLHGGKVGFNKVLWTGKRLGDQSVEFTYVSKDGEEGYPGTLTSTITYTLNDANELKWEAKATTDAPTVLNLVHHSYWNLSGTPTKTINDHVLQLEADKYLPTNAGLIPTGELAAVTGTPMDFTKPTAIGARVGADFPALKLGLGYDHCWVLRPGNGVRLAARLVEPQSGRVMEISTNQPAIQFYGGNFLDGTAVGKKGVAYQYRTALCLETENYPDAPNQPAFPTAVLNPGQTYLHTMVHKFSVAK